VWWGGNTEAWGVGVAQKRDGGWGLGGLGKDLHEHRVRRVSMPSV
jgi:hypothetical protein